MRVGVAVGLAKESARSAEESRAAIRVINLGPPCSCKNRNSSPLSCLQSSQRIYLFLLEVFRTFT